MLKNHRRKSELLRTTAFLTAICILALLASCVKRSNVPISPNNNLSRPVSSGSGVGREIFPDKITIPVLMFHDVKTHEGGTWSISAENLRKKLEFLLANGYTPISFEKLVDYVDEKGGLPEKPVCITFDDGYFSNYKTVLPIVTELNVPVTVFMVCKTVREKEVVPNANEDVLCKMSAAELRIMEASDLVSIQSHTYGLHGENKSYSDEKRSCILPLAGEKKEDYKAIFARDCETAEKILAEAGVPRRLVLAYPEGRAHEWAEEVLRERGYRVSLTTDYGHKNHVTRGDKDSLYMLGRMNVNDATDDAAMLKYLERD